MGKVIYLDAAASSLKPQPVIETQVDFLQNKYANAGRGVCARASNVDAMVNSTRCRVAEFINAVPEQIVFTGGTTDGINRIAGILKQIPKLNESKPHVTVSDLDHHSARLPFEHCAHAGIFNLDVCPLDNDFNIDINAIGKTDIMVITAMSNVLGVPQRVRDIVAAARAKNPNVITIVDAAQYVAHNRIDVVDWDCDFLCFSGHKIGTDTGVGIMYIKNPNDIYPDKFGGGMVIKVNDDQWTLANGAEKFEAGTLPLTQISGIIPAIDNLIEHMGNSDLIKYLYTELSKIDRIKILSSADAALLTFVINDMHPLDFGAIIGAHGVCLRVGNMCATWVHDNVLKYSGTIRISCGWWNTHTEMQDVVKIIKKILG